MLKYEINGFNLKCMKLWKRREGKLEEVCLQ